MFPGCRYILQLLEKLRTIPVEPFGLLLMDAAPKEFESDDDEIAEWISHYLIEDILGEGSFGRVYLALDTRLDRKVAIKVLEINDESEIFWEGVWRREARILAALDHPNIVPVFDAGQAESGQGFIVSKYIVGQTLAARHTEPSCFQTDEGLRVLVQIARALQCAHDHRLVHRDVKPGNIMIDDYGHPYLIDFGLTLFQENLGQGPKVRLGTPPYMSPEQARGDAELVSGRSDVFSLGVILYEMLTGTSPFDGDLDDVLDDIKYGELVPPSSIREGIPPVLEELCLAALSRLPGDRPCAAGSEDSFERRLENYLATTPSKSEDPATTPNIVPRGLNSFGEDDSNFFLKLLPGPRDRRGLPACITRWKSRIEATNPEETFRVGVIYGASGSGKSSLVKSGILPRLDPAVIRLFVEAERDTEEKLVRAIHHQFPRLDEERNLSVLFERLLNGEGAPVGCKILIVIDQFEQYLHGREESGDALVDALRKCDGTRLLALTVVRDDFWVGISRVFENLSFEIDTGANAAAVDLFSIPHAEYVLTLFGKSYRALPEKLDRVQQRFVKRAIRQLAQNNKVAPVRIALFAEMFRTRSWTPFELQEVGGMSGLGVLYLDECLSKRVSGTAGKQIVRLAEKILEKLLPTTSTDIRGTALIWDELREAAGLEKDSREFDEIFFLLTREFRIISPVQGSDDPGAEPKYGLAHDYLVPSIRRWLDSRKMGTRAGRAELKLRDSVAQWGSTRNRRYLPNAIEWWQISLFSDRSRWSEEERDLMKIGAGRAAFQGIAAALVGFMLIVTAFEMNGQFAARALFSKIMSGEVRQIPEMKMEIQESRKWLVPMLHEFVKDRQPDDPEALLVESTLNQLDLSDQIAMVRFLTQVEPSDFRGFCSSLGTLEPESLSYLQDMAANSAGAEDQFRASLALHFSTSEIKADRLVRQWLKLETKEVVDWARVVLSAGYEIEKEANAVFQLPLSKAEVGRLPYITAAHDCAKVVLGFYAAGDSSKIRELLGDVQRADERTFLIEYLKPSNIGKYDLWTTSEFRGNRHVLAGLLQSIGEVRWKEIPESEKNKILRTVISSFHSPHIEVRSSARYALKRWGRPIPSSLEGENKALWGWIQSESGLELAILPEFNGRHIAVVTSEIRKSHFMDYFPQATEEEMSGSTKVEADGSLLFLSAIDAARYCNALSESEGLEPCYVEKNGKWYLHEKFFERSGYRLPTVSEWKFACKGGVHKTFYYFGSSTELIDRHANSTINTTDSVLDSDMKRPNPFGLFDILGNAPELIHRDKRLDESLDGNAYAIGGGGAFKRNITFNDVHYADDIYGDSRRQFGIRLIRTIVLN